MDALTILFLVLAALGAISGSERLISVSIWIWRNRQQGFSFIAHLRLRTSAAATLNRARFLIEITLQVLAALAGLVGLWRLTDGGGGVANLSGWIIGAITAATGLGLIAQAYVSNIFSLQTRIQDLLGRREKPATVDQQEETNRLLREIRESLAKPPEGASEISTDELAKAAGPNTEAHLQEALELQAQNKEREAIDALYEAFRRDLEPVAKAELHLMIGTSFLDLGELEKAEGHYRQAFDAARGSNLADIEADTLASLGNLYKARGELDPAQSYYEQAGEIYSKLGNQLGEANQLSSVGLVLIDRGDLPAAEKLLLQALKIHRRKAPPRTLATSLGALGNLYRNLGDLSKAEAHYRESVTLSHANKDRSREASGLAGIGNVYYQAGKLEDSESFYRQALALYQDVENPLGAAVALTSLGNVYSDRGDPAQAQAHYRMALEINHEIGNHLGEANAFASLGLLAAREEKRDEACIQLRAALSIYDEIGAGGANPDAVREALEELGCDQEGGSRTEDAPTG